MMTRQFAWWRTNYRCVTLMLRWRRWLCHLSPVNCWFGRTFSPGRWWGVNLWPAVQFDWICGIKSFQIHAKWLLWEFKLNTFWGNNEET